MDDDGGGGHPRAGDDHHPIIGRDGRPRMLRLLAR